MGLRRDSGPAPCAVNDHFHQSRGRHLYMTDMAPKVQNNHFILFLNDHISQTGYILRQMFFFLMLSLPPFALSATQQKSSAPVKVSDTEMETLRVCQVPIPGL